MVHKPGASAPTAKRGGSGYANAAGDAGDAASLTADTKHLESGHKQHRTQQHQYGASRVANKDSEDADEGELRLANDISTQLAERGFAVVRGIIAESSIARARAHLQSLARGRCDPMHASWSSAARSRPQCISCCDMCRLSPTSPRPLGFDNAALWANGDHSLFLANGAAGTKELLSKKAN